MAAPPEPVHRRTIEIDAFDQPDRFRVVGRLRDERPWAAGMRGQPQFLHDMVLEVEVDRSTLAIVAASADMRRFPHPECRTIEDAFGGLVGLNVARGYNREVQARFGRALGCSHLEFLARAIGPVVVQAMTSTGARDGTRPVPAAAGDGDGTGGAGADPVRSAARWLADTCHLWAVGGVGEEKLALGWRPGVDGYPSPTLV
ncbi:MAG: DUF2889 domain-containing protein, partial [Acidimicrobiales bacterium]